MNTNGLVPRALLTAAAVAVYRVLDTAHEIVSPLVSGPMAAQQLSDSNSTYIGTQVASRVFNGSGFGGYGAILLAVALIAIWYKPVANIFRTNEKV